MGHGSNEMPSDQSNSASGGSKAQEDYEEVYIYEAEPDDAAKQAALQAKKKAGAPVNKQKMQRMLKFVMSGRKPKKTEVTPIYEYNNDLNKEVFLKEDTKRLETERIYEVKKDAQDTPSLVYSKRKETYNETPITAKEAQEGGSYSTRNMDYPIDETPYGDVLLEEIVTEGKLRPDLQQASKQGKDKKGQQSTEHGQARKDLQMGTSPAPVQAANPDVPKREKKKTEPVVEEIIWDD